MPSAQQLIHAMCDAMLIVAAALAAAAIIVSSFL